MSAPTAHHDLDLDRDLNLEGRSPHVWYRRIGLAAMLAFVVAALAGLFGQEQETRVATGDAAEIRVRMPDRIRGGLMFPVRIEIEAKQRLAAPQVVLGPGFIEGMHLNSLEPAPTAETSRPPRGDQSGALALTYPTLEAGDTLTVYLQLQVNPTTVGNQDSTVSVEAPDVAPVRSVDTLHVLP